MDKINLPIDARQEEQYAHRLSPFEEYLPGMRPNNSGAYLLMLGMSCDSTGWMRSRRVAACSIV